MIGRVPETAAQPTPQADRPLGPKAAAALVFGSSAAVLVVELVMLRLLAPYLAGARLWLAALDTNGPPPLRYLHRHGAPIRYGHVPHRWPLRDHQTVFATYPGSAEMPSAGRPFTHELVTRLIARGIDPDVAMTSRSGPPRR